MEQVTIHTLLKNPDYRRYFLKTPSWERRDQGRTPQWRLLVQYEDESWSIAHLRTYARAFERLRPLVASVEAIDAAISHRRHRFKEPHVLASSLPHLPSHSWCPYCRRPTLFVPHDSHHMDEYFNERYSLYIPSASTSTEPRCSTCGTRLSEAVGYQRGQ